MQTMTPTSGSFVPLPHAVPAATGTAIAIPRQLRKDEELFAEGDNARFFYKVVSGAVRTYKLLSDERRQIQAFHLAGAFVGIEAGEEHCLTADDGQLVTELVGTLLHSLQRAPDHMLLLGRKSAMEKVATFLLDMARRSGGKDAFELPMSRVDIADHLGLTIETVSRCLSELERRRVITLPMGRRVIALRDKSALRHLDS